MAGKRIQFNRNVSEQYTFGTTFRGSDDEIAALGEKLKFTAEDYRVINDDADLATSPNLAPRSGDGGAEPAPGKAFLRDKDKSK